MPPHQRTYDAFLSVETFHVLPGSYSIPIFTFLQIIGHPPTFLNNAVTAFQENDILRLDTATFFVSIYTCHIFRECALVEVQLTDVHKRD